MVMVLKNTGFIQTNNLILISSWRWWCNLFVFDLFIYLFIFLICLDFSLSEQGMFLQ